MIQEVVVELVGIPIFKAKAVVLFAGLRKGLELVPKDGYHCFWVTLRFSEMRSISSNETSITSNEEISAAQSSKHANGVTDHGILDQLIGLPGFGFIVRIICLHLFGTNGKAM